MSVLTYYSVVVLPLPVVVPIHVSLEYPHLSHLNLGRILHHDRGLFEVVAVENLLWLFHLSPVSMMRDFLDLNKEEIVRVRINV